MRSLLVWPVLYTPSECRTDCRPVAVSEVLEHLRASKSLGRREFPPPLRPRAHRHPQAGAVQVREGGDLVGVARRHGDFAIVGVAASLTVADGTISDARLAFAGVSDVPVRAAEAEDLLVGERPSAELFEEAAIQATAGLDPPGDLHGSPDYRKKVAATLVRRGLQAAADNAGARR